MQCVQEHRRLPGSGGRGRVRHGATKVRPNRQPD
jgi:hypothetical protein